MAESGRRARPVQPREWLTMTEDLKRTDLLEQVTVYSNLGPEQITDSRRLLWCKLLLGLVRGAL